MSDQTHCQYLIFRAGNQLCGLPLEHVDETMRPQPVRAVAGMPPFVRGVAKIRGLPVPVVDAASLLNEHDGHGHSTRFVVIKAEGRRVVLAVEEVLGIRPIDADTLSDLPPLLGDTPRQAVSVVARLDHELLLVLQSGRFVPDAVWTALVPENRVD